MLKRREMTGLLLAATSAWTSLAEAASTTQRLFTIARSKNANLVHYTVRTNEAGLELAAPLHAYWEMLAEDGRREALSWAERKLAYGFSVSKLSADGCRISLVAFKERPIHVERSSTGFQALVTIAGRRAILKRIFAQSSEGAMIPSVQYLDVFGASFEGALVSERITRR